MHIVIDVGLLLLLVLLGRRGWQTGVTKQLVGLAIVVGGGLLAMLASPTLAWLFASRQPGTNPVATLISFHTVLLIVIGVGAVLGAWMRRAETSHISRMLGLVVSVVRTSALCCLLLIPLAAVPGFRAALSRSALLPAVYYTSLGTQLMLPNALSWGPDPASLPRQTGGLGPLEMTIDTHWEYGHPLFRSLDLSGPGYLAEQLAADYLIGADEHWRPSQLSVAKSTNTLRYFVEGEFDDPEQMAWPLSRLAVEERRGIFSVATVWREELGLSDAPTSAEPAPPQGKVDRFHQLLQVLKEHGATEKSDEIMNSPVTVRIHFPAPVLETNGYLIDEQTVEWKRESSDIEPLIANFHQRSSWRDCVHLSLLATVAAVLLFAAARHSPAESDRTPSRNSHEYNWESESGRV